MVRFKNRWLLVEFVFPSSQPVPAALTLPSPSSGSSSSAATSSAADAAGSKGKGKRRASASGPPSKRKKKASGARAAAGEDGAELSSSSSADDDSELEDDDKALDDPPAFVHPRHPLLLPPPPNAATGQARALSEKAIHAALKASVLQAFGDDGWAKVASNTNVKYYSSQTQTAILRTSRDHYRIVQAALTFLGPVNNERVIANVLHVSGTIKKIQLRQVSHNRALVATILASLALPSADGHKPLVLPSPSVGHLASGTATPTGSSGTSVEGDDERERRWRAWEAKEQGVISGLVD